MSSVINRFRVIVAILALSLLWVIVIPGWVAYCDGVFYEEDLRAKLPIDPKEPKEKLRPREPKEKLREYREYKDTQDRYKKRVEDIDSRVSKALKAGGNATFTGLSELREQYRTELTNLKQPVTFSAFFWNRTNNTWLANYVFLSLLALLLNPNQDRLSRRKVVRAAIVAYVGIDSIGWLRNFLLYDRGRVLFSYVNYDISPTSFLLQELRFLGMCIFLAVIWQQWALYFFNDTKDWASDTTSLLELSERARHVSQMFTRWQVNSIVLAAAFLPWTIHYWRLAAVINDHRYYLSALAMHLYWAITWVAISAPLVTVVNRWSCVKSAALALASARTDDTKETDRAITFISQLNPLSTLQIFAASVAAAVSFSIPYIDVLKQFF